MKKSTPKYFFPDRLRQARENRQLTKSMLAERAKLQPSTISHFEAGSRKPSFDNLRKLANALEVTTDYLLGRSDDPLSHGQESDPIYRDYEKLSSEDREIARDFIKSLASRNRKKG